LFVDANGALKSLQERFRFGGGTALRPKALQNALLARDHIARSLYILRSQVKLGFQLLA